MSLALTAIKKELANWKVAYNDFLAFGGSRMPAFKTTRAHYEAFLDATGDFDPERAYISLALVCIDVIKSNPTTRWTRIPGAIQLALEVDKDQMAKAIFNNIIEMVKNDAVYERVKAQSINTPNFGFSQDTTTNIVTGDMIFTLTKANLQNSEFAKYKYFETTEEANLYVQSAAGLVTFLGNVPEGNS